MDSTPKNDSWVNDERKNIFGWAIPLKPIIVAGNTNALIILASAVLLIIAVLIRLTISSSLLVDQDPVDRSSDQNAAPVFLYDFSDVEGDLTGASFRVIRAALEVVAASEHWSYSWNL